MEADIITAYNAYRQKLAECAATLKSRVKAVSSLRELKEKLGLTANMYYQRLNYPQNIPIEEVKGLAELLKDDSLIQLFEEAHKLGHQMTIVIDDNLKRADITVTFLCKKLGIDTSNFYRKQKDPRLWSQAEIERITQVVETIMSL